MVQPIIFEAFGKENLVCKLKKYIYGLKQASHQWYLKFDEVITHNGFKENIVDQCIYLNIIFKFIKPSYLSIIFGIKMQAPSPLWSIYLCSYL